MNRRMEGDGGTIVLGLAGGTAVLVAILFVVGVEVAAYLHAASRAQQAADAAALAAIVRSDPRGGATGSPSSVAERVAVEAGGELGSCDCEVGAEEVRVVVSVPVTTLLVGRIAAHAVHAEARARLAPPPGVTPP